MPGLFLIAHEPLASALKCAAQHCFPEAVASLQALDVSAGQPPEEIEAQARILLQKAQDGDERGEVLIPATPSSAWPMASASRSSPVSTCRCSGVP
jgi:PTS system ascorbate-specific IIA component